MDPFSCHNSCCIPDCNQYFENDYENYRQNRLDAPEPWVGVYIAAASAVCSIAMAADAGIALRTKRFWVPCKYFSLNAFSLTLLSVVTKLPLDFTALLNTIDDRLARVSSLVLMSIAMANFMASLGAMEDNEIKLNLAALGLLVTTIAGNLVIRLHQISKLYDEFDTFEEEITSTVFMLFLLATSFSSAIMVPTAKRYVEAKYQEMHGRIVNKRVEQRQKHGADDLKVVVKRYWLMAETGSLQFVVARSVAAVGSGIMSLLTASILVEAFIRLHVVYKHMSSTSSDYKWSTKWILETQCIGVAFGTIAPLLRLFVTAQFKTSMIGHRSFKDEFKVEDYWTRLLVNWRDSPLPLQFQHWKVRKLAHDAKRLLLNFCIGVQTLIVRVNKLVLLVSAFFMASAFRCFCLITKFKAFDSGESVIAPANDLRDYVVLLEGETELPAKMLDNICIEMDRLIHKGRKKKPENLIKLLCRSTSFNGVREFDNKEIGSLNSPELPNSWSLPVVTLTSVAIALASITDQDSSQLISGVSEGLALVKLIESTLDKNGALKNARIAADMVWIRVELYGKWLDQDIQVKPILGGPSCQQKLQDFSNEAEKIVLDFIKDSDDFILGNPKHWPCNVIVANSMYRITQTLMQQVSNYSHRWTDDQLLDKISSMISDILAACLTNLVHVIPLKCYSNAIKERETNVHQAAILLGESEEILEILQQRELPNLDLDRAAYIDEWRTFNELDIENPSHT